MRNHAARPSKRTRWRVSPSDPKGGETIFGSYAENWIEVRRVKGEP